MVAPSFKNFTMLSEQPFIKNGKSYVKVKNPSTGSIREVRWYTDAEFAKNYGKKLGIAPDDGSEGLKQARGFNNGPILVIRRNKPEDEEWLRQSIARYALGIGWYIASTDIFPADAPKNFKYVLLNWDEAKIDERHLKKPNELAVIIDKKIRNKEWFNIND